MSITQFTLWTQQNLGDDNSNSRPGSNWYYLHDTRTDTMMILDDTGEFVWTTHDTVNEVPHLYNNRRLAKEERSRQNRGTVKTYPYRLW